MILPDFKIRELCERADAPLVTPYDSDCVNPASIDLRLGHELRRPSRHWERMGEIEWYERMKDGTLEQLDKWDNAYYFDTAWLLPGQFMLCHSLEFVRIPRNVTAMLYSKSSTGRIGLEHLHAGLGDPGFGLASAQGAQWTFEFHNVAPWPIELKAGMRVMQMQLVQMFAEPESDYTKTGRYNFQSGATPVLPERA